MWWTSFRIRNFRSIEDVSIEVGRGVVCALVGVNGTGKTAILDGIDFFRRCTANPPVPISVPDHFAFAFNSIDSDYDTRVIGVYPNLVLGPDYYVPLSKRNQSFDMVFDGYFDMTEDEKNLFYSLYGVDSSILMGTKKNPIGLRVTFSYVNGVVGERKIELLGFDGVQYRDLILYVFVHMLPDTLCINADSRLVDKISLRVGTLETQSKSERLFEVYFIRVMESIIGTYLDDSISIAGMLSQMEKNTPEDIMNLEVDLEKISSCINNFVGQHWETVFGVKMEEKICLHPDCDSLSIVILADIGGYKTSMSYLSNGVRDLLRLMIFTYLRGQHTEVKFSATSDSKEAVKTYNEMLLHRGTLLLFDEPAAALHESAQAVVMDRFESMASEGRSLIYSTHNHSMIKPSWLETTYIVENQPSSNGVGHYTKCVKYKTYAVDSPGDTTYFQPLLDALMYQQSALEAVSGVYLMEGKTDYYLLRFFSDVVFISIDVKKYSQVKIAPGANGANGMGTMITFYIGRGMPFKIMLDGDAAGESAKKRYIRDYPISDGQIFCISDIHKSFAGKTPELLITDYDKLAFQKSVFPNSTKYDKQRFHHSLQKKYVTKDNSYIFSKETMENFRILLDYLVAGLETMK